MVWFYLCSRRINQSIWFAFQSHYGLILSRYIKQQKACLINTFNPTMVWFYLANESQHACYFDRLSIPLWSDFICFNTIFYVVIRKPFNPTMVWFYHNYIYALKNDSGRLSIPLWSDFIDWQKCSRKSRKNFFQSHYGLILSQYRIDIKAKTKLTFNPTMVWFYHRELLKAIDEVEETFNPILVWFYPYCWIDWHK